MSIKFKVVFVVIIVMLFVFGFLLVVVTLNTRRHEIELEERMRGALAPIVRRLVIREGWDRNRTKTELGIKLDEAVDYKLIRRYAVVGLDGELVSSHNVSEEEYPGFVAGDEMLAAATREMKITIYPDEKFLAVPVSVGGRSFGAVKLEVNVGPRPGLGKTTLETFTTLFAIIVFFTLIQIAAIYLLLNRLMFGPLVSLVDASRRLAEGDYSARVNPGESRDEMQSLIDAFNAMTSDIRDYHFNLERKVEEATGRFKEAQRHLVIAQRLAATGTLAAGIAHEVNNPLGGMLNATRRLLKDAKGDEKREQYLQLIHEGLERVQDTVAKILSFARRDIIPQAVVLRDVTRKAVELVAHKTEKKNVTVVNTVSEDLPAVFGDPAELQQVMLNLLMNAVDAIDETGGTITISGRQTESALEVSITDTGCGMDEETQAKAFDLFFTTKEAGRGTGLGISIVHNIIQNHHGSISIKSAPGKGTTVELKFPIIRDRESGRFKLVVGDGSEGKTN